jgi:hypothetical protein
MSVTKKGKDWRPFEEAREFAQKLGLKGKSEWRTFCKLGSKPEDIPSNPWRVYSSEYQGIADWLGTGNVRKRRSAKSKFKPFSEAREFARALDLAHWYAVLDMTSAYEAYREVVEALPETNLQLWFPDESTDNHLYREDAGFTSGATLSSIQLPATLGELKAHIVRLHEERRAFEGLSCFAQGWRILALIASRHFRTPIIPAFWQEIVTADSLPKQQSDGGHSEHHSA